MDGEYRYLGDCVMCGSEFKLDILNEEETPLFCPLCGNTLDYEVVDSA
jgi:rRNA maturation endonuclease Nob1